MRKRTSILGAIFLIAALTALVACGKVNDSAPLVDSSGKHPANWITTHGAGTADLSVSSCTQCHGADLTGGISKVSCMSTTPFSGFSCHATSPADNPNHSFHPANWISQHKTAATAPISSCTQCHAGDLTGGIAKVSCTTSSISGFSCHFTSPAVNPTGCKSCHSAPPSGTTAPNRAGAHDTHLALLGVTCASCHQGAGSGTANHAKGSVTVSLPDTLKAKAFTTFGLDSASDNCSGIICHGGQATPSWSNGSINVDTDCLKCHAPGTASQIPQYNSFYSGQLSLSANPLVNLHKLHLSENIPSTTTPVFCTNCHNTTILDTQHFAGLATQTFEATAASTIGGSGTLINDYVPYTSTAPSGSCTSACHSVINDNPRYWVSP